MGDMLYITMKKKGWTLQALADELTKQQEILGYRGSISKVNLCAKIHIQFGEAGITPELARRIEIIMGLEKYSLVNMCPKRSLNSPSQKKKVEKVDMLLGEKEV